MDFMKATFEDIVKDAKQNKHTHYLKDLFEENPKISYMVLKRAYFNEYYPEKIPKAKAPKLKMVDIVKNL